MLKAEEQVKGEEVKVEELKKAKFEGKIGVFILFIYLIFICYRLVMTNEYNKSDDKTSHNYRLVLIK